MQPAFRRAWTRPTSRPRTVRPCKTSKALSAEPRAERFMCSLFLQPSSEDSLDVPCIPLSATEDGADQEERASDTEIAHASETLFVTGERRHSAL